MKSRLAVLVAVVALASTSLFAAETFKVDKGHSSATFKVRHLVANFTGKFNDFDAAINIDRAKPANSNVQFTIQAASIDTDSEKRDQHLRGADFFDVEKFPTITFKSTAVAPAGKDQFKVTGDLTMHGVTKRITLPVSFLGFGKNGRGQAMAGFEIETTVNRKDYGIVWNRNLDEGAILLGEDVKVIINLEAVAQAAPAAAAPATK